MAANQSRGLAGEARDRAITGLAILKVNFDRQGLDYIDYFVPLVGEALRGAASDDLGIGDVAEYVRARFGLKIPHTALKTILRRAASRGLVAINRGRYRPLQKALETTGFEEIRERALEAQRALIDRFVTYALKATNRTLSEAEAVDAILEYVQLRGIAFLRHVLDPSLQIPITRAGADDLRFITSGFVIWLSRNDVDGLAALETVVKGAVLAGAVYAVDLGRVSSRFEQLDVYLDTRILLHLLGLAGSEAETGARELVELGTRLGARFYCFDHTTAELRGVLLAASNALRYRAAFRANTGETLAYLAGAGTSSSDVELLLAELDIRLREVGVSVRAHPPHVTAWTIDEKGLGNQLTAAVTYRSEEPLLHDINSITAIQRIRRNESFDVLEGARAIFVTTNRAMARVANQFFAAAGLTGSVPLIYSEQEFGTLAWLKSPALVPDLPLNLVIADTLAALNPPEALWREYLIEIDRLEASGEISADEYLLLRFSTAARSALLAVTGGRPDALVAGTVPEVLSRARDAIVAEAEPEILNRGREAALTEVTAKIREQVALRDEAERAAVKAQRQADAAEKHVASRAAIWGTRGGAAVFLMTFVGGAALTVGLTIAASDSLGRLLSVGPDSAIVVAAVLVLAVLGVLNLITGLSVLGIARRARDLCAVQVERWLVGQFLGRGDSGDLG